MKSTKPQAAQTFAIQSDDTASAVVLYGPTADVRGIWDIAQACADARSAPVYLVAYDVPCAIGFRVDPKDVIR